MKTTFIKLFVFSIMLFAISCNNDKLTTYEDVDRIYFTWAGTQPALPNGNAQLTVALGYDVPLKADSTIQVKVNLMGKVSNVDRPFSAELIPSESSAIQGEDIEILPSVIPALSEKGDLRIKLINDTAKLTKKTLMARIRLLPNEYFHVDYTQAIWQGGRNALEFDIFFDAKTDMPNLWSNTTTGVMLTAYFGKYSKVKLNLICEVCGVTRDFFMYDPATENPSQVLNARMPTVLIYGMISQCNRYLKAYAEEHKDDEDGGILKDENGEVITIGNTNIL